MNLADVVGALIGFVFTILVFTYLLGDNFLFRVTIYIFIGVAAAFVAVVALYNVILYQVLFPLLQSPLSSLRLVPPLILGMWLLVAKSSTRLARWGNPVMAFLVGIGAATAIGGAVMGTLLPQVGATMNLFDWFNAPSSETDLLAFLAKGVLILVGVLTTLVFFHFGTRPVTDQAAQRPAWIEALARVGQFFIAVALGMLFAGVYASALTALIERLSSLIDFIRVFLKPL